ncbi:hypothetical protein HZA38_01405 [Candidatus Peregrinibacteria bacterium]|nr:hypothetical protein [Candidatus Peregrinibacteria bacterium]
MTNKWTTLHEDNIEETHQNITSVLDEDVGHGRSSAKRHQIFAVVFAVIGILLIGVGGYPFLVDGNGKINFAALISTPETVDKVEDVKTVSGVSLGGETKSNTSKTNDAPESDKKDSEIPSPDEKIVDTAKDILGKIENVPSELQIEEKEGTSDLGNSNVPFKTNTHTGKQDLKSVVIGGASSKNIQESLHGAAEESGKVAKSGPEAWIAGVVALGMGLILRRKKRTA